MTIDTTYLDADADYVKPARSALLDVAQWINAAASQNVATFGAVGDGVTDDTLALQDFFQSAIDNPGVAHYLNAALYAISDVMPTINVPNVIVRGMGAEIHDVGDLMTGTVLVWIGAAETDPIIKISAVSGALNQRVCNVEVSGIGINCASGTADYGVGIYSVSDSLIDVAVANADVAGVDMGVVASLGEARDNQRNRIHLTARQVEDTGGYCLQCGGDTVANTSMNEFWVDAQHTNSPAIVLSNSDNNDWWFIRAYRASGTATESVSCLGGATEAETCRLERFHFLSGTVGLHVYGTGTYTVASANHQIFSLDTGNGTPAPTIDTGASAHWRKDTSGLADDAWTAYTPTVSASSGTITTASATGYYKRRGNQVDFKVAVSITTNGTGAGTLQVTTPIVSAGADGNTFVGCERAVTGKVCYGYLDGASSTVALRFYDGTYPGANGAVINMSGVYQVA